MQVLARFSVVAGMLALAMAATGAAAWEGSRTARERALVDTASSEPIEVTLASRMLQVVTATSVGDHAVPKHNSITFRIPAAYFQGMYFGNEDPRTRDLPGGSSITLLLWSRSFDPVRPDVMADRAECRRGELPPCEAHLREGGREVRRRRSGEFPLQVRIGNSAGSPENREYNILSKVGLATRPSLRPEPCDFREEPAWGMLVGRTPTGDRPGTACNVISSGVINTRTGRFFDRATFLRRAVDGNAKFGVVCPIFVGPDAGITPTDCELTGGFGVWPIFLKVPSDRVADWDEIFDRLRAFLVQHVVSRTD